MFLRLAAAAGLLALVSIVSIASGSGALADDRCSVALADWQPREALAAVLERAGWANLKIRVDDGCYKVMATDRDGRKVKARFDPATLERLPGGDHDEHGRSSHGHGHEDERD